MFANPLLMSCSKDNIWYRCFPMYHQHINQYSLFSFECIMSRTDVLHCIFNTSTHTHFLSIECHMPSLKYRIAWPHQPILTFWALNVTCLTSRTDVSHCIINTLTDTHILSIECHTLIISSSPLMDHNWEAYAINTHIKIYRVSSQ